MRTLEKFSGENGQPMMWFKRLGVTGFLFFLAKGLVWIAVPALIAAFAS